MIVVSREESVCGYNEWQQSLVILLARPGRGFCWTAVSALRHATTTLTSVRSQEESPNSTNTHKQKHTHTHTCNNKFLLIFRTVTMGNAVLKAEQKTWLFKMCWTFLDFLRRYSTLSNYFNRFMHEFRNGLFEMPSPCKMNGWTVGQYTFNIIPHAV